jgi:hypothetical protein
VDYDGLNSSFKSDMMNCSGLSAGPNWATTKSAAPTALARVAVSLRAAGYRKNPIDLHASYCIANFTFGIPTPLDAEMKRQMGRL